MHAIYNSKNGGQRYEVTQCVDAKANSCEFSNHYAGGCLGVRERGAHRRAYGGSAHGYVTVND